MKVGVDKEVVVAALKECYDPEIPVNVYDLGLIYDINVQGENVKILMTMTSPYCPISDYMLNDIKGKVGELSGATNVTVEVTFDPPWTKDMISDEARAKLGL